jgi:hypothetical protein
MLPEPLLPAARRSLPAGMILALLSLAVPAFGEQKWAKSYNFRNLTQPG